MLSSNSIHVSIHDIHGTISVTRLCHTPYNMYRDNFLQIIFLAIYTLTALTRSSSSSQLVMSRASLAC